MRKNRVSAVLALILVAAMLLCACGNKAELSQYQQRVAALEQENAALKDQVQVLTRQLENLQSAVLTDWSLNALASQDRTSVTITFNAVPAAYPEGQTVSLVIRLNDFEAESVQCVLEEKTYTATVELPSADGYSYYCLITSPGGTQQEIPLVTPDTGNDAYLRNISSSLNGFSNLIVEKWEYKGDKLTLDTGYVQAQMPLISAGAGDVTPKKASLVLIRNGEEIDRASLELKEGEGEGTFEAVVGGVSFTVKDLAEDDQLDLVLEIELSAGDPMTNNSCSWFYMNGELSMVVG